MKTAKGFLIAALVIVVGMAFRVSWNALRDVARAIGADPTAALLYPFVVDGLMAVALVAALVLVGRDRRLALRVLGGYTTASLVLNYVHGLVPGLHEHTSTQLADWSPANWALVLLATSLPVGSIFFGSDLVARVLHAQPAPVPESVTEPVRSMADQEEASTTPAPEKPFSPAPEAPPVDPTDIPAVAAVEAAPKPDESTTAPVSLVRFGAVAESTGSARRRATGRLPKSAKTTPTRTRPLDELLTAAREIPADERSAERIRTTLRVGSVKARQIRDLLTPPAPEGA